MIEAQRLAAAVVAGVCSGRSLDAELAAAWRRHGELDARARGAAQDLAYGTLRFLGRLEALLDALLKKPLEDARLRALLLVALYQLDRTRAAPHAIVDHAVLACGALGLTSAKGLANAVLRGFLRRRTELDARVERIATARYSHPQWWIDRLQAQYPGHYARVLEAGNSKPPLTLRVNRRRAGVADYLELLERGGLEGERCGEAAVMLRKAVPAARIPGLAEGLVSVQDAGAQLAAPLLDLADGQRRGARPATPSSWPRWS
jgi:16S rRNA (cytosine967-C5)-methyltransferase